MYIPHPYELSSREAEIEAYWITGWNYRFEILTYYKTALSICKGISWLEKWLHPWDRTTKIVKRSSFEIAKK